MVRYIIAWLLILAGIIHGLTVFAAEKAGPVNTLNAEAVPNKPRCYFVSIKFTDIDAVIVREAPGNASPVEKCDQYHLLKDEWSYSPDNNLLTVTKDIDTARYVVLVNGKYQTPLCIALKEETDPNSIRCVIKGKIGIPDRDYHYDSKKNTINLVTCKTGQEKFFVKYPQLKGCASVGSLSLSELTRPLREHLGLPVTGNTHCIDDKGQKFSLKAPHRESRFKHVWLVQLIPLKNGYTGKDLFTGFHWDAQNNELTLDAPVDIQKFAVRIYGTIP